MLEYHVYGFNLRSAQPIPWLAAGFLSDRPTLEFCYGQATEPDFNESWEGVCGEGEPHFQSEQGLIVWSDATHNFFCFEFHDGTRFHIALDQRKISASWPKSSTLEDAVTYLLGPVLSFIIRAFGQIALHASAVEIDDSAVLFVGPSGSGKSTLAASFAKHQYSVLSDDIAVLSQQGDTFIVVPGYPGLRLWEPSVEQLFGSGNALPNMTPTWDKRFLSLESDQWPYQSQQRQLAGIFFLAPGLGEVSVAIEAMDIAPSTLIELVANTSANKLLTPYMREQEFKQLGRLCKTVPIKKLAYSRDSWDLEALREAILSGFRTGPRG